MAACWIDKRKRSLFELGAHWPSGQFSHLIFFYLAGGRTNGGTVRQTVRKKIRLWNFDRMTTWGEKVRALAGTHSACSNESAVIDRTVCWRSEPGGFFCSNFFCDSLGPLVKVSAMWSPVPMNTVIMIQQKLKSQTLLGACGQQLRGKPADERRTLQERRRAAVSLLSFKVYYLLIFLTHKGEHSKQFATALLCSNSAFN